MKGRIRSLNWGPIYSRFESTSGTVIFSGLVSSPEGFLKLNVDGAVSKDWRKGGIGGLIRNSQGQTLSSFSESIGFGPPVLVELKAIKAGLGIHGAVSKECECRNVVNWIENPIGCPLSFEFLVKEIEDIIRRAIRFVTRSANREADELAKKGIG
ncbi:uncharacterized protein LOC120184840 [Hibiscus syriacus]|uniref:uncharacterized protein LOC120184840 n=1 Tax=Hibiscus syriacus TaxID=106335 RepID=UPI001924B1D1|nr:uncharacterized protein LOC120184840 [Hibiscus syriacus]